MASNTMQTSQLQNPPRNQKPQEKRLPISMDLPKMHTPNTFSVRQNQWTLGKPPWIKLTWHSQPTTNHLTKYKFNKQSPSTAQLASHHPSCPRPWSWHVVFPRNQHKLDHTHITSCRANHQQIRIPSTQNSSLSRQCSWWQQLPTWRNPHCSIGTMDS